MVLIGAPLHDIACPVVFIDTASLPDFLGDAIAEIGKHYARTILPEFSLYKYTPITSNLVDEVKVLASSEDSAKYSIFFAGDLVRTLAELPGPGKALADHLRNAVTLKKPCELKLQDPVFKSLLPSRRLDTLELAEKIGTAFILPGPIIASAEGRFDGDKKDGLVRAIIADLGIHAEPTPNPFFINDKEEKCFLLNLRFGPQSLPLESSTTPLPSALQLLCGEKQAATQLLPYKRVFLSESILLKKENSIFPKENSSSLANVPFPQTLLEQYPQEQRRNSLPLLPSAASQLRQISSANDSKAPKYIWKPEKRSENKLKVPTKRKLSPVQLLTAGDAAASSAARVQNKKKRTLLAEAQTKNSVEEMKEDVLVPIEVPLLHENLKAAIPRPSLVPLDAFPELLRLPPGATDPALGFITTNTTDNNYTTHTANNTATVDGIQTLNTIEIGSSIRNIEACSLLWDLLAKEMAPAEEVFLLPTIALAESGLSTALHALYVSPSSNTDGRDFSSPVMVGLSDKILQEGGVMQQSTGSLAVILDWSLSTQQASLRNPELLETCKRVKHNMDVCVEKKKRTLKACCSSTATMAVLSSLLAPFSLHNSECKSESFLITSPSSFNGSVVATALGDGTLAATPCNNNNNSNKFMWPAAGAPVSTAAEGDDLPAAKRPRLEPGRSTAVPPDDPGTLALFMKLNNKNKNNSDSGAAAAAAAVGNGVNTTTTISNASNSSMSDGLSDSLQLVNSLQTITTTLPSCHTNLLLCVQKADAALLASVPSQFLPPGVSAQDFPALDYLNTALRSINTSNISAAGEKPTIKMLAGVAILRQTAKLVIHHGIRAGHLYFSSSLQELPGVCNENSNSSKNVAQVLADAAGKVESGEEEDHPKHTALRQTLMTINTLETGSKILVVGDPKSFFTLYSVIHVAGLRPCHLDREGQLLPNTNGDGTTGSEKGEVAVFGEAVDHACIVANCILAAAELVIKALSSVKTREMLLNSFQHVVIYVSEPDIQQKVQEVLHVPASASAAAASNMQPACSITVLAVSVKPLELSPQVEQEQLPLSIPSKQQILPAPAPAELTLKTAVPTESTPDWPLVLSNSAVRPVKSCRKLYESLITLENEGTVIIERSMQHVDMVLSPSAALIMISEDVIAAAATTTTSAGGAGPDFELFIQHVTPIFERIGRSFSKLHLICEGSAAFRAQLLCGNPRLVSAAARCNLTLQCDVTLNAATTSLSVRSIAASYLQEWKERSSRSGGQNLFYSIGDPPSQVEIFLAATPSLNPHSAAVLAKCGLTLQQLFSVNTLETSCGGGKVPAVLGLVPTHSMELFVECCSDGQAFSEWKSLNGRTLFGDGGEVSLAGAASTMPIPMPVPPLVAPQDAPTTKVRDHPRPVAANIVDDLPESLDEFIEPSVRVVATPIVPLLASGGSGRDVCAGDDNDDNGIFSSAVNGSAESMPAPSWCGPQLGTDDYVKYPFVQQRHHQQQCYSNHEDQRESLQEHSSHPYLQQMHQDRQPTMYQKEEMDEYGVALDPEALWAANGRDDEDAQHSVHQQHQQHGYGLGYNNAVNYDVLDEQEAVSGYAPPWIEGGMPLPGLAPKTRMQAPLPRKAPYLFNRHHHQQRQQQRQQPSRSALVNDNEISGLSSFRYGQNLQQERPFAAPVPSQSFQGGTPGSYTAAALMRQQQQHSASTWQAPSTAAGNAAVPFGRGTGLSGVDYMKRKWGGSRRGGGRGGKWRKFSSRTRRQW